jgi:hypothetical protein
MLADAPAVTTSRPKVMKEPPATAGKLRREGAKTDAKVDNYC